MRFRHLLGGAFALLLLLPLRAVAENIDNVDPTSLDYGEVLIGNSETAAVSFQSVGPDPLVVENISVTDDETGSFQITSVTGNGEEKLPPYYFAVPVGDEVKIEVTFTPHVEGLATAQLYVLSNAANLPSLFFPLQGKGVVEMPTPEAMMQELIEFYDAGVGETICGLGGGNSATSKLRIFGRVLDTALDLIVDGDYVGACDELERAFLRSDDAPRPNDWIDCDGASTVNTMIGGVMDAIDCE